MASQRRKMPKYRRPYEKPDISKFTNFMIRNEVLIGEKDPIDDNFGEQILKAFKSRPDFIGQVDAITGEENTFQQMRERSVKCALWLKKLGIQRNDFVAIYTYNHLDTYIPYLATLYIGAILTVWEDPHLAKLRRYLESNPKVIFTDADKVPLILNMTTILKKSIKIVVFKEDDKEERQIESIKSILNSDFDETEIDKFSCTKLKDINDTAVILFSAGTTGSERAHVTISYSFFTASTNQQIPVMTSNDVGLWVESLHWNISLLLTVRAILSYVKVIKANTFSNLLLDEWFFDIIQKHKVTWMFLKSDMRIQLPKFSVLENFKKYDTSSLKQVIFGGRIIKEHRLYKFFVNVLPKTSFINVYCLPETGVITYQRETGEIQCSGCVSKEVHLFIAEYIFHFPLEANKMGAIWCKSPALTNGYFTSFTPRTFTEATDNDGWFRTDDYGYYDENGNIYIHDCVSNVIKYRNDYFSPSNIEKLLYSHPEVLAASVVSKYNMYDGHHPSAYVIRKERSYITEDELIEYVAKNVPDYMTLRGGLIFHPKMN